jgi:hypothetical protein
LNISPVNGNFLELTYVASVNFHLWKKGQTIDALPIKMAVAVEKNVLSKRTNVDVANVGDNT